jgi:hypothetical protein
MADSLDQIFTEWLNAPANKRPSNAYEWFGLTLFEDDQDIIMRATNKLSFRLFDLKQRPTNSSLRRQKALTRLLFETLARDLLLQDGYPVLSKAKYDARLGRKIVCDSPTRPSKSDPPTELPIEPLPRETVGSIPEIDLTSPPGKPISRKRKGRSHFLSRLHQKSQFKLLIHFLGIMLGSATGTLIAYVAFRIISNFVK